MCTINPHPPPNKKTKTNKPQVMIKHALYPPFSLSPLHGATRSTTPMAAHHVVAVSSKGTRVPSTSKPINRRCRKLSPSPAEYLGNKIPKPQHDSRPRRVRAVLSCRTHNLQKKKTPMLAPPVNFPILPTCWPSGSHSVPATSRAKR